MAMVFIRRNKLLKIKKKYFLYNIKKQQYEKYYQKIRIV